MTRLDTFRRPSEGRPPLWLRRALPVVLLAVLCGVLAAPAEARRAKRPQPVTTPVPTERAFGVAADHVPWDLSTVDEVAGMTGREVDRVTWYSAWAHQEDFPAAEVGRIADRGATPVITWEAWDPAAGTYQPEYSLDRIAAGRHDRYLTRFARQVRSYGRPLVIRLGHEMNGSWYPWAEGVNGNGPGDFVAAWRHVVDLFRGMRVTNVTWSWSPNIPYDGSTPLPGLFPGDAWVDEVALDGYNWGTTQPWSSWQSFGEVFGPGVQQLSLLSRRPIHIGETGSAEHGGDKGEWVRGMFAWLERHPEVRSVTWFQLNKETDWRINSSDHSLDAFRAGLATY
ncbi:glycoside hydrolase family 26 protein [Nocardioides sp. GCM10027113]|uniref:glycoside hydrolase family 26 protein n=1 Tax=unclassified Nocardioides TaxID=2615069 RepID=UPI00360DD83E